MIKTLVLSLMTNSRASYYSDWQDAFLSADKYFNPVHVKYINVAKDIKFIRKHISSYEFIVLLHSCFADTCYYTNKLVDSFDYRKGKLLVFLGNEYNMPSNLLSSRIKLVRNIEPNYIATQLPLATGKWIYDEIKTAEVIAMPHALNDKVFLPGIEINKREIDFGVRTFKYPCFLGDQSRNFVTEEICKKAVDNGYFVDCSFKKRLPRVEWSKFLQKSKFTVSTPAGSDYISHNDEYVVSIAKYICENKSSKVVSSNIGFLRYLSSMMPFRFKVLLRKTLRKYNIIFSDDLAEIDDGLNLEIENKFFKNKEKSTFSGKSISSRHFDAIGTKTIQILLEGDYNGILKPNEHYIPIKKDLSNVEEIFKMIKDVELVRNISNNAYSFVMDMHTYSNRMDFLFNKIFT